MLNQAILVGTVEELKEESIKLLVSRRDDGEDIIEVNIGTLLTHKEYLKVGSTVGVKARLVVEENQIKVISEKMTFIRSE